MLTITAGTHTAARAGYTIAKNGSTKNNTLTITDGTVGAVYGGWTEGKNLIASTAVDETHPVAVNTGANAEAEGNKLSLSGGTIGANGKIAGGYIAKYTLHQSHLVSAGDAKTNKVNISGGTIGDNTAIYGGYAAGTGAASGAQVTLQDKATVGGNLYGGYTAGAGAASDATITLKGAASVAGDLYGGFSAGTGATTGNVVNLGDGTKEGRISFDETNKRPRVTSVTGTIYGGSDASNTTGNIKNFAAVKFHYNQDTTSAAAPMLKITDGVATAFDWSTFDYTGGIPMSGKLTIMANAAGINVANYTGARDLVGASANSEITIDTENHTASSKKIVIDGLTFRYAKVKPEANTIGTDEEDVWGGRSVLSNTTTHNVLTIDKGTEHRDAYGGWTAGKGTMRTAKKDSTENTVNLVDGKVRNLYGGFTASADASAAGSATKNTVNLSGGEATGTVYGGFISHTGAGDATGNAVAITGGTMKDIYGGYTNGTGQTTGNTVTIGDGTNALPTGTNIAGYLYGGNKTVDTDNKLVVNTAVSVKNIKHFEQISFNISHVSNATTPFLKLTDGVQTSGLDWDKVEVTGANDFVPSTYRTRLATLMHNDQGIDFTKAGVNTYNPIRAKNRESGDLEYTIDTDNPTVTAAKKVYVDGFRFRHNKGTDGKGAKHLALDGTVAAAYGANVTVKDGAAQDNAAEISGGTVTGNAYGGALTAVAATKNAAGGSAHITGGSVGGNVYGGAITDAAASGNVTGSSVHVAGGTVSGTAYGGHNAGTGNTLAIYPGQSAIHDFSGVQKLRFYLPNDARASYTPMLQLGVAAKDIRNLNIGVGFSGSAPVLHGNDVISLMKTLPGGTLLTDADIANQIEGTQGVTMRYQFALQKRGTDELVLTLIGAAMNDQTKSLVEPRCGATDFINRGADLLAASGISSAAKEGGRAEDDEKRGYQLWAAMSQGTMRAETGSYVTTNGYNLSVGWAKEGRLRAAKTLFTPFVEYGRGTYHTYLDDGTHGNGKISYLGAGLMGASNARTDAGRRRRCTAEEYEAAIAVMSLSGRSRPTTAKMPTMRRISASERRGCSARVIH